jgi:hypothetical protein
VVCSGHGKTCAPFQQHAGQLSKEFAPTRSKTRGRANAPRVFRKWTFRPGQSRLGARAGFFAAPKGYPSASTSADASDAEQNFLENRGACREKFTFPRRNPILQMGNVTAFVFGAGESMANKALVWPVTNPSYASVFRDLKGFFAKTWVWILLLWAEQIAVGLATPHLPESMLVDELTSIPSMLIFAGVAVAWHRKILVDERKQGLRAVSLRAREWKYFAIAFLMYLGALVPLVAGYALTDRSNWWAISLFTLLIADIYIVTRLSVVYPLLAIDESEPFSRSWRLLRGRVFRTFMIFLLTTIPLSLVGRWIDKLSTAAFDQGRDLVGYAVSGISCAVSIMSACVLAASLSLLLMRVRDQGADSTQKAG